MISRRTALALAETFARGFHYTYTTTGYRHRYPPKSYTVDHHKLYDFLYAQDYDAWFCNEAEAATEGLGSRNYSHGTRSIKEFIMRLHTGETFAQTTEGWTREQREKLGQRYLQNLAQDILNEWESGAACLRNKIDNEAEKLIGNLELDGYIYRESRLLSPESDVLDVEEETALLQSLYTSLGLENEETAFHHLALSEEHFLGGKWDDSISNSRKFLECVLQEVAAAHSLRCRNAPLPEKTYNWPARVREYLEGEGLLEAKEKTTIAEVYGLLSQTGGHPYMARNDQARLLRHLALTFAQFVMLRFDGSMR